MYAVILRATGAWSGSREQLKLDSGADVRREKSSLNLWRHDYLSDKHLNHASSIWMDFWWVVWICELLGLFFLFRTKVSGDKSVNGHQL